jgi:hypothetical protein
MSSVNCTDAKVSTTNINAVNATSPTAFLDQAIALETVKILSKALSADSGTRLSVGVVSTIVLIISIDGLKRVVVSLIDRGMQYLSTVQWKDVKTGVKSAVSTVGNLFTRRKFSTSHLTFRNKFEIDGNQSFWRSLFNSPHFHYRYDVMTLKYLDNSLLVEQTEQVEDAYIETTDFLATFNEGFTFKTRVDGKTRMFQETNKMNNVSLKFVAPYTTPSFTDVRDTPLKTSDNQIVYFPKTHINWTKPFEEVSDDLYYSTLKNTIFTYGSEVPSVTLDIPFKNAKLAIADWLKENLKAMDLQPSCKINYYIAFPVFEKKPVTDFFYQSQIWRALLMSHYSEFPKNNVDSFRSMFYLLSYLIMTFLGTRLNTTLCQDYVKNLKCGTLDVYVRNYCYNVYVSNAISHYEKNTDPKTGSNYVFDINKEVHLILQFAKNAILPMSTKIPKDELEEYTQYSLTRFNVIPRFDTEDQLKKWMTSYKNKSVGDNLSVSLSPISDKAKGMTQAELSSLFTSFSKDLIESYSANQEGKPVSIKMLRYNEKKVTEKREDSDINNNNSDTKSGESMMFAAALMKMQTRSEPVKEKTVRTLECEDVNTGFKSFNTLYLREGDRKKLFGSIERFKNKKELLKSLGLPYKLGVLLYGLPGCGKSSTILSIASYLQKDVFYIDLKTVKTNQELKEMFDLVYKTNANGGIIAFEDIDCASPVVLKRKESTNFEDWEEESVKDDHSSARSVERDPFTLDFLLNLLQGTLTRDGTLFIATTNYIDKLDEAFIRDGRFDVKIEMKMCNTEQVRQMAKVFFGEDIPESLAVRFKEYQFTPSTILNHFSDFLTSGNEIEWENIMKPFV